VGPRWVDDSKLMTDGKSGGAELVRGSFFVADLACKVNDAESERSETVHEYGNGLKMYAKMQTKFEWKESSKTSSRWSKSSYLGRSHRARLTRSE
jgi:hypothetical protein